jgi:UMF1 family MFS transporter
MFGQFIPEEKKSEMYGFYALTGKFAAILGPAVYAFVITLSENAGLDLVSANKYALLSVLIFFVVSLIILKFVQQPVMGKTDEIFLEDDQPFA